MGISIEKKSTASLRDLIRHQKETLLSDCLHRMLEEYAGEAAVVVERRQDRFTNPVAYAFRQAIETVLSALADGVDPDLRPIEYAVKIRAVQEKDPRKGVSFIYLVKDTIMENIGGSLGHEELAALSGRIERIALAASEMFTMQRKKIIELCKASDLHGRARAR